MTSTSVILECKWKTCEKIPEDFQDVEELGISKAAELIAKKELRENKNAREQCLYQLRNWIRKNEDIENVRTDDNFLLRFLRVKKFSIPMAEQMLLKYLNMRKNFGHMVNDLDYLTPEQYDILTSGYIFVSPIYDRYGRRVIIMNIRKLDTKKYTSADMAKAHFIIYETLLDNPENQIMGVVYVVDFTGVTSGHITMWNPTEFSRIFKWGDQSLPVRHKGIHIVGLPASIRWILDFVKSRISDKIKERFHTYANFKDLYNEIDPSVLPLELGGTIPMNKMIESWKSELKPKRDILLALDKMKILSDRGIIKRNDKNNNSSASEKLNIDSLPGSFRKLELD